MKSALILGGNSDIGKEIAARLVANDWHVESFNRDSALAPVEWDLLICCIGILEPIGNFFEVDAEKWNSSIVTNALLPLRLLRLFWAFRKPGASVCFFSGAGTSNSAKTYSAYSSSKMLLYKMTELLDDEESEVKFFILGPGMVRTKIQQQTLNAGDKAANFERVKKFMEEGDDLHKTGTSHDKIFDCLMWCASQPKEIVGGRNFYVPDFPFNPEVQENLKTSSRYFKLRRLE